MKTRSRAALQVLRSLNGPCLHFLLLGTALYLLKLQLMPAPKPVIGPLSEARKAALVDRWQRRAGRPADATLREALFRAELDRDMLFAEALAAGLHRDDPVVRRLLLRDLRFLRLDDGRDSAVLLERALSLGLHLSDESVKQRLVQRMEAALLARQSPRDATGGDRSDAIAQRQRATAAETVYTLRHIFYPEGREQAAVSLLRQLHRGSVSPQVAAATGAPFTGGHRFVRATRATLEQHFGTAFMDNLVAQGVRAGAWAGPVRSLFGTHLVFVEAVSARASKARERLAAQRRWERRERARREALQRSLARLRERYAIRL